MSSRRLDLTEEAERDIQGILRFTRATWGERQRLDYRVADQAVSVVRVLHERMDATEQFAS